MKGEFFYDKQDHERSQGKGLAAGRVDVKKLATMAMLVALAYVVTVVTRFPLMAAASYLKYDPRTWCCSSAPISSALWPGRP